MLQNSLVRLKNGQETKDSSGHFISVTVLKLALTIKDFFYKMISNERRNKCQIGWVLKERII